MFISELKTITLLKDDIQRETISKKEKSITYYNTRKNDRRNDDAHQANQLYATECWLPFPERGLLINYNHSSTKLLVKCPREMKTRYLITRD